MILYILKEEREYSEHGVFDTIGGAILYARSNLRCDGKWPIEPAYACSCIRNHYVTMTTLNRRGGF